jgi:general secretion pathway protein H
MAARIPMSPPGADEGFTLLEIVCVMAIISILAALILPAIPRGTSRTRLEAFALQTAALLKTDRLAAMQRRMRVATELDPISRSVRSGATGGIVVLPRDVGFDALLASRCNQRAAGRTIDFFPSGMSCGGTIALSRPGGGFQVRVNWLTGGVEIVPVSGS